MKQIQKLIIMTNLGNTMKTKGIKKLLMLSTFICISYVHAGEFLGDLTPEQIAAGNTEDRQRLAREVEQQLAQVDALTAAFLAGLNRYKTNGIVPDQQLRRQQPRLALIPEENEQEQE
jgi:hypothetical protein